jgi:hypothetical protein|tara:strand:- start:274 stop:540 length:267 start_codon:yes stop_codon:yes gene_type:complete
MEKYSVPEQEAFYKQILKPEEDWFVGLFWVKAPDYELDIKNHEKYKYPVDGWFYAATPPQEYLDWVERNKPIEPIDPDNPIDPENEKF